MSVNPFPFTQTRDFAATSALELGSSGTRAVSPAQASKRIGKDEAQGSPKQRDGTGQGKPREERERDAQRHALAKLILGAFDVIDDLPIVEAQVSGANPQDEALANEARAAARNLQIEQAILEFMYALFHALDQLDDAEPTVEFVTRPMGIGPGSGRAGRNAFGERLELLAQRVAAVPVELAPGSGKFLPGFEGVDLRLASGYGEVLRLLHGDVHEGRLSSSPRAQLTVLLLRLANAIHIAPTLGYGLPSAAGAMLRVRA